MAQKEKSKGIKQKVMDRLADLEHTLEKVYAKLVTERKWFVVTSAAITDFWEKKLYYFTGHFTYNALLAMLAMLFAATAVVGLVLRADPSLQGKIRDALQAVIPVIGGTPSDLTKTMVDNSTVVGIIGIFGLLWTGTKIYGALEQGLCMIWGVKKRTFVKRKVLGFLLICAAGTIVIISIVVQLAFAAVWGWLVGQEGFWYSAGTTILRPLMGLAVNFALFLFIYQVIPPVKQTLRWSAIGAAVSAAIFLALQYILAFYFGSISNIPSVYGSMATVVVMTIWLHLTGMVLFLGAEIIHAIYDEEMVEEHKQRALPRLFIKREAADDEGAETVGSSDDNH